MFIPIHDGQPVRHIRLPYVTWGMIALCGVLYGVTGTAWGLGAQTSDRVIYALGVVPASLTGHAVLSADIALVAPWLTLLTYAVFHADFWHLLGNLLFLYVFGDNVEDAMGHGRFAVFYVLCAGVGGAFFAFLGAQQGSAPLIGASGAVSGIVVAYMMLHPDARVWVLAIGKIPMRIPAFWCVGAWIVFQFVNAFVLAPADHVGWLAHVGGIVAGAVLVVFLKRPQVGLLRRTPSV